VLRSAPPIPSPSPQTAGEGSQPVRQDVRSAIEFSLSPACGGEGRGERAVGGLRRSYRSLTEFRQRSHATQTRRDAIQGSRVAVAPRLGSGAGWILRPARPGVRGSGVRLGLGMTDGVGPAGLRFRSPPPLRSGGRGPGGGLPEACDAASRTGTEVLPSPALFAGEGPGEGEPALPLESPLQTAPRSTNLRQTRNPGRWTSKAPSAC
jgi:hypothetical protein